MVADEVGVKLLHPGERTVVNSETEDAEVVRVENSVAEAVGLPEGQSFSSVLNDPLEDELVLELRTLSLTHSWELLRKLGRPQIIEHWRDHLLLEAS